MQDQFTIYQETIEKDKYINLSLSVLKIVLIRYGL